MGKASYDLTTLDDCFQIVRALRWRAQKKSDHIILCAAVRDAFDTLYQKTHSSMFAFECGPGMDYQEAVEAAAKKAELDILAKDCKDFLLWELTVMRERLCEGPTDNG